MENQQLLHAGAIPRGALIHAGIPNVVAGPFGLPALHRLRSKYVSDWQCIRYARLYAATRYHNKHLAGMVTLAVIALYAGVISLLGVTMKDSISPGFYRVLEYITLASTWATLIFGLVELPKQHRFKARELRACAAALDELQKDLAEAEVSNESQLLPFVARYRSVMERYETSHAPIDMRLAALAQTPDVDSERKPTWQPAEVRYHLTTYGYYVAMALMPVVAGVGLWWIGHG